MTRAPLCQLSRPLFALIVTTLSTLPDQGGRNNDCKISMRPMYLGLSYMRNYYPYSTWASLCFVALAYLYKLRSTACTGLPFLLPGWDLVIRRIASSVTTESFLWKALTHRIVLTFDAHTPVRSVACSSLDPFHCRTLVHHFTARIRSFVPQQRLKSQTRWDRAENAKPGLCQPRKDRVWRVSPS